MAILGLLFDKDGTLIDFPRTWGPTIGLVARELSAGDDAAFDRLCRATGFDAKTQAFAPNSVMYAGPLDLLGQAWASALGRTDTETVIKAMISGFASASRLYLTPIGDPASTFRHLRAANYRIGLATNDSEAAARLQASLLGIEGDLEFVAGFDSGYGGKPDPGMIFAFAEACGLELAEVAMIGDSVHDLAAARNAKAMSIAVLSGPASREALEPYADYVIDDISGLSALLERLRAEAGAPAACRT